MLTPNEAHKLMVASGKTGMDDPTESGLPWRWWYDENGTLCCAVWRSATRAMFQQFTRPNTACSGLASADAPANH